MKKYSNCIRLCISLLTLVFISSCYKMAIQKKHSYALLIKSKKIRFNDIVLISKDKYDLSIQAFTLGKSMANISINQQNQICLNYFCYESKEFNEKFLSPKYKDGFLNTILRGELLFNKKYTTDIRKGFKQKKGSIAYKKIEENILFKDTKEKIIIKLTKIKD